DVAHQQVVALDVEGMDLLGVHPVLPAPHGFPGPRVVDHEVRPLRVVRGDVGDGHEAYEVTSRVHDGGAAALVLGEEGGQLTDGHVDGHRQHVGVHHVPRGEGLHGFLLGTG